jgi:SH3 domain-containing YSC84-like protein 1
MKRLLLLLLIAIVPTSTLLAADGHEKTIDRVDKSGKIIQQIMNAPDSGIPDNIFSSAKCIAVVPSMLHAGFAIGGSYGKGVASCRTDKGWSAPAFFTVRGGSFGFQIGGEAIDLIMVVMNDEGMKNLLSSKFELGASASAAAGPVGRHASGDTDWQMRAQILTYSRARGVFAGLDIKGALVTQGKDDTRAFYGRMVPFPTILNGNVASPDTAKPFLAALEKYGPGKPAPVPAPAKTPAATPEKPATVGSTPAQPPKQPEGGD